METQRSRSTHIIFIFFSFALFKYISSSPFFPPTYSILCWLSEQDNQLSDNILNYSCSGSSTACWVTVCPSSCKSKDSEWFDVNRVVWVNILHIVVIQMLIRNNTLSTVDFLWFQTMFGPLLDNQTFCMCLCMFSLDRG